MTPPRAAGVSTRPARSTSRVISYATSPRSQVEAASTARLAPLLIAMMTSTPRCISTTVWTTAPPSKTREAPWVRLVRPDVTAASWSARACGNPAENASGRPSDETTTAWATSGTRSTKFVISQLRSWTGRPGVLTRAPLLARTCRRLLVSRLLYPWVSSDLWLLVLRCGGTRVAYATLEARHPAANRLRRTGWRRALRLFATTAAADRSWHEVSPRGAFWQPGRCCFIRRGLRSHPGGAVSLVCRGAPSLPRNRGSGRCRGRTGAQGDVTAPPEPVRLKRVEDRQPVVMRRARGRRNRDLAAVGADDPVADRGHHDRGRARSGGTAVAAEGRQARGAEVARADFVGAEAVAAEHRSAAAVTVAGRSQRVGARRADRQRAARHLDRGAVAAARARRAAIADVAGAAAGVPAAAVAPDAEGAEAAVAAGSVTAGSVTAATQPWDARG